ncbi:unnamed protein product, partial [Prunus brigantina]
MAFFKCFKKGTVTILEDESDNRDEGTTLLVDTGSSKAFELLSDRIHNGAVNWGSAIPTAVFASLFSYDRHAPVIRAFCEYWCPATNTLHMSQGEMSISLWDLHEIGGLPITGRFYDEVIPTTESLNRKDHKGVSYIPHICRYLFLAYHKILRGSKGKSGVRMTAWIKYWYRGPFKYKKSSRKTVRNKSQKPKEDSDPSGIIPTALKRTEEEEGVFEDLGIADEDMEKSYLAAFLAC